MCGSARCRSERRWWPASLSGSGPGRRLMRPAAADPARAADPGPQAAAPGTQPGAATGYPRRRRPLLRTDLPDDLAGHRTAGGARGPESVGRDDLLRRGGAEVSLDLLGEGAALRVEEPLQVGRNVVLPGGGVRHDGVQVAAEGPGDRRQRVEDGVDVSLRATARRRGDVAHRAKVHDPGLVAAEVVLAA